MSTSSNGFLYEHLNCKLHNNSAEILTLPLVSERLPHYLNKKASTHLLPAKFKKQLNQLKLTNEQTNRKTKKRKKNLRT